MCVLTPSLSAFQSFVGGKQCIRPDGSIAFTNVNCEEDGCLDPVTDCEDLKFTFEPFDNIDIKMFDLSRFGVPVAIAGIMYIVIFSPFLLPGMPVSNIHIHMIALGCDYLSAVDVLSLSGHETLKKRKAIARGLKSDETSLVPKQNKRSPSPPKRISSTNSIGGINAATGFHDFIVGARVTPNSPAINKTVRDAGLRDLDDLFLVSVIRQGNLFSSDAVGPDFAIAEGDILEFAGLLDSLGVVCKEFSLQPITHDSHGHTASAADGNAHASKRGGKGGLFICLCRLQSNMESRTFCMCMHKVYERVVKCCFRDQERESKKTSHV